jgi:tetratricopeptide (TPR) repeat protein
VRQGLAVGPGDFQQQDFALPSSLVSGGELVGDLDAIILKALRRDPAERYGTVEQFDDDLQRFLERRPVLARRGSRRYRLGRFIARHRLPIAAAAAVLVSLITGLVLAERERRNALEAQARAERHFASVRGLANAFIYDIEIQLRDVAGTLPARQLLVETSVKYLDRLAGEVNGDPALAAELAGGYRRMGEVLGSGTSGANFGRWDEAIALFEKAAKLLDDLGDFGRASETVADDRQRVHYELAGLYSLHGDPRWEEALMRAIDGSRELARLRGNRAQDLLTVAVRLLELANMQAAEGRVGSAAEDWLAEANALLVSAEGSFGADDPARSTLAAGYLRLAEGLTATGRTPAQFEAALAAARKSGQIAEAQLQGRPYDTRSSLSVALAGGSAIEALIRLRRFSDSEAQARSLLQQFDALGVRDSANMEVASNHWAALTVAMETAWLNGDIATVLMRAGRSDEVWETLPDAVRSSEGASPFLAKRDYYRGLALLEGQPAEFAAGCEQLRHLQSRLPKLLTSAPGESRDSSRFSQLDPALARCSAAGSGTSPN